MKVRSLLLPRNGNCLENFQAESGRLPVMKSILEGGEGDGKDNFNIGDGDAVSGRF